MLRIEIKDTVDKLMWNELVRSLPEGTIFQTTYWADYLKSLGYSKIFYFIVREGQHIKAICLLWVEILSARNRRYHDKLKILDYFSRKANLAIGNWQYGPLIFDKMKEPDILEIFIREADKFCKSEKLVAIRNLASPLFYSKKTESKWAQELYIKQGFRASTRGTVFLDLSRDLASAWAGVGKDAKSDLRRGLKHNLSIEFMGRDELPKYKKLMLESIRRTKMPLPPHYPEDNMWSALCKDEECLKILSVKSNGMLLGAKGVLEFNGIIFQICSFQSDISYYNKLNVNDIMTWEVIKWGIANKKRVYDLTGIPVNPINKKDQGLRRYKMKWATDIVIYNTYEKIYRKAIKIGKEFMKKFT